MKFKFGLNLHTFLIVLLLAVGLRVAGEYSNSTNIAGFAVYENLEQTCKGYFGDKYCDDSPQDCGQYYQKGTSRDDCDECQTLKDEKAGFGKCVKNAETPATLPSSDKSGVICAADVQQCPDGSFVSRDPAKNCEFKACSVSTEPATQQVSESAGDEHNIIAVTVQNDFADLAKKVGINLPAKSAIKLTSKLGDMFAINWKDDNIYRQNSKIKSNDPNREPVKSSIIWLATTDNARLGVFYANKNGFPILAGWIEDPELPFVIDINYGTNYITYLMVKWTGIAYSPFPIDPLDTIIAYTNVQGNNHVLRLGLVSSVNFQYEVEERVYSNWLYLQDPLHFTKAIKLGVYNDKSSYDISYERNDNLKKIDTQQGLATTPGQFKTNFGAVVFDSEDFYEEEGGKYYYYDGIAKPYAEPFVNDILHDNNLGNNKIIIKIPFSIPLSIKGPDSICTESDVGIDPTKPYEGKNYFEKGIVTFVPTPKGEPLEDYCESPASLIEYFCATPDEEDSIKFPCNCENGACKKEEAPPQEIYGDFDGDGCVVFADFVLFSKAWGSTQLKYDLDGSGVVDFGDFLIISKNMGKCKPLIFAQMQEIMNKLAKQAVPPSEDKCTSQKDSCCKAVQDNICDPDCSGTTDSDCVVSIEQQPSGGASFNLKTSGKTGSCASQQGKCNGAGSGNCYCDSTSVSNSDYGDYCMDILTYCPNLSSQVNVKFKQ